MLFPLLLLFTNAAADFSPSFNQFLTQSYGPAIAERLARRDLGPFGSFGGGSHQGGQRTVRQAAVLVHGITNNAHQFSRIRDHFFTHGGYGPESVFATTYGDAGRTAAPLVDMKCDYIKQTRMLIQAVAAYTRRKVDVLGYSMGSPVARKAILGGPCVDTGEQLGPPLTPLVDTFVSVAGANQGSYLCLIPFPGACNMINGLSCNSQFLNNINTQVHYEGSYTFSIWSTGDDKVGHMSCGRKASAFAGSNGDFEKGGKNHDQIMFQSAQLQLQLIVNHSGAGVPPF